MDRLRPVQIHGDCKKGVWKNDTDHQRRRCLAAYPLLHHSNNVGHKSVEHIHNVLFDTLFPWSHSGNSTDICCTYYNHLNKFTVCQQMVNANYATVSVNASSNTSADGKMVLQVASYDEYSEYDRGRCLLTNTFFQHNSLCPCDAFSFCFLPSAFRSPTLTSHSLVPCRAVDQYVYKDVVFLELIGLWVIKHGRQGEANNPGPTHPTKVTKVYVNNITSYYPSKGHLQELQCDFAFWQETKVQHQFATGYASELWRKGWEATFGPLPDNTVGVSAGMAGVATRPQTISPLNPINLALQKLIKMGRLQFDCIPCEGGESVICYNCYAWSDAQQTQQACYLGDNMFHECHLDAKGRGDSAIRMVGYFNAHISRHTRLMRLINEHE